MLLVVGLTVVALSCGVLYWQEVTLLADARTQIRYSHYDQARQLANQVIFPPFTIEASKVRDQVDTAERQEQASRAAQLVADKLTSALNSLDKDSTQIDRALTSIDKDESAGVEASKKRHDDAISGNPDLSFDLSEARTEETAAEGARSDVESMISPYRDEVDTFRTNLDSASVSKLEQAVETASSEYETYASSWESAVQPMIDSMTQRQNGNYFASTDSSQVQRFYADSTVAWNKGNAALSTANSEVKQLRLVIQDRLDKAKAQITQ